MDANHAASPAVSPSRAISRRSLIGQLSVGAIAMAAVSGRSVETAAQGTPSAARETPNTFRLAGDGIEVTYATTSFTGQPSLAYRGAAGEHTFSGPHIREDAAPFGRLVTVVIEAVADGYSDELTVVLPQVNLTDGNEPTDFSTLAILTRHLTTIAGPGMLEGQIQHYDVMQLEGTAELLHY